MSDKPNQRIAVVLQPNWIQTAKDIFRVYGMNNSNLKIATSTQLINADENYDVVIVHESISFPENFLSKWHLLTVCIKEDLLRMRTTWRL
ncbi:hypothetical protein [Neobacillus kokaensis]|uniref:Uncharacterized protein n=1 Tax=Neobacillus kokaensis TaxID=2759023 RepID=A0ABQ3N6Z0_9BACI|nr:hypothetical protein [Neobacillus kokaensis]GHH99748.1 hypothetical protein AM1BK_32910 [Neobacillus kokaensis]